MRGCEHLMTNSAWDEAQAVVLRLSPATTLMKLASRLGDVALYGTPAQMCMSTKIHEHLVCILSLWQCPT